MKLIETGTRKGGPPRPCVPPASSPGLYAPEDTVSGMTICLRQFLTCPSQFGQGSEVETQQRDLRAELLQAEAAHFAKKNGVPVDEPKVETATPKRQLEGGSPGGDAGTEEEDPEAKRRRILEETRDIDADSDESEEDSSEDERSDLQMF